MHELDSFFRPDTIAVVGASRDPDKIGHTILQNFNENEFPGEVVPVNPNADEILGYDCVPSVTEIEGLDHAVIAVPPGVANDVVQECVDAGVPAVTIITSGYEEVGGEGKERQQELEEIVAGTDTRVLGPNCLGIWDAYSKVDTLFVPSFKLERPPKGAIAFISQSGAVGSSVMDMAAAMDIGFSRFISYGNQADVTETELLEWLAQDDETEAIAVYMEGVKEGHAFLEKAKEITDETPVAVLKGGKSSSGSAAASSHTGSLAGSYQVYQGVFQQTGVIEAGDAQELFNITRALAYEEPPEDNNIAIVTNGGGYGVLAADRIEQLGMELAEFSDATKEKLEEILPDYGTAHNPLDVIGDADVDRYEKALEAAADDPNVDGIVAVSLLQPAPMGSEIVETLAEFNQSRDKPIAACMVGGEYTEVHLKNLEHHKVPTFGVPEQAVRAMKALVEYGDWRRRGE